MSHLDEVRAALEERGYQEVEMLSPGFLRIKRATGTYEFRGETHTRYVITEIFFGKKGEFKAGYMDGKTFAPSSRNHSHRVGAREAVDNFIRYVLMTNSERRKFRWEER